MTRQIAFVCPACAERMNVTELTCPHCLTKVQGDFSASPLHRLKPEQLEFVEVFLRCRGNIKEAEKELKISYPTVRARLDQIIRDMGYPARPDLGLDETDTQNVLDALGNGEVSFEEALERIKRG